MISVVLFLRAGRGDISKSFWGEEGQIVYKFRRSDLRKSSDSCGGGNDLTDLVESTDIQTPY